MPGSAGDHAQPINASGFLCARRERPSRRTTEQCYERASPHGPPFSEELTIGGCIVHHGKIELPLSQLGHLRSIDDVRCKSGFANFGRGGALMQCNKIEKMPPALLTRTV